MILLFSGANYYPKGGWEDFKGKFDDIEQAKQFLIENYFDNSSIDDFYIWSDAWAHIVKDGKIVLRLTYNDTISDETFHQWIESEDKGL